MKIGVIRCMQTEDMCPGGTCFASIKNKKFAFEQLAGELEVVGWNTCGGCPGKKIVPRVLGMVQRGAEAIVLASCMTKGTPIGFVCPHVEQIKEVVKKHLPQGILLIEYSH